MNTLQLLDRAHSDGLKAADLARDLHVAESTLSQAKARGRLSPTLAGRIAEKLGLDPIGWIALAAIEAEKKDRTIDALRRKVSANLRIFARILAPTRKPRRHA